jgi:hypothetical protein
VKPSAGLNDAPNMSQIELLSKPNMAIIWAMAGEKFEVSK